MKEKIVVTINNESLPQSQCRKFDAGWYKIGDINVQNSGGCYFIGDQFYREETGRVVFDLRKGSYVLKNQDVVEGIITFDNAGYNLGHFTYSDADIVVNTVSGNKYPLISEEIILDNKKYKERLSNGEYYDIELLPSSQFNKITPPTNDYKTSLPYDSKGITDVYLDKHVKSDVKIHPKVEDYSKILEGLSFGLEFETVAGVLPTRILDKTALIPLRDGSIAGIEYVTVPLEGAKGIQTLLTTVEELNKRTKFDDTCSMHLHLGNVPRTKEFILAFFKLSLKFQNDIFEMFPLYKKYNFGVKRKNYSKPYDRYQFLSQMDKSINSNNINDNFDVLYSYLSQGEPFGVVNNDLKNVDSHPADRNGTQKWNIANRYYFHNFIPLIFGNKQTIEFRIHTPTYDANKILFFLYFNSILVNFTKKYEREILQDPYFLSQFKGLKSLVIYYIENNVKSVSRIRFRDFIIDSIDKRKGEIANQSAKGDIVGKENNVRCSTYINWKSYMKITDSTISGNLIHSLSELDMCYQERRQLILDTYHANKISLTQARVESDALEKDYRTRRDIISKTNEPVEW